MIRAHVPAPIIQLDAAAVRNGVVDVDVVRGVVVSEGGAIGVGIGD